jgi:hypothetical protein
MKTFLIFRSFLSLYELQSNSLNRGKRYGAGLIYPDLTPLFNGKIGSGETNINLFGSPPIHKNRPVHDGTPPQGLSEARRVKSFF